MGKSMRRAGPALPGLAAALLLAALAGGARAENPAPVLKIESFKVVWADATEAQLAFTVSINTPASKKPLYVGATAKTRDGTLYSSGYGSVKVTAGQHVHFEVMVDRPWVAEALQTDHLSMILYRTGGAYKPIRPLVYVQLEWKHNWPAGQALLQPPRAPGMALSPEPRYSTTQIFNQNLGDEDFAALDLLLSEWNDPRVRDVNGDWKLSGFIPALDNMMAVNKKLGLEIIQAWERFNPHSPGAAIAEARYWYDAAWKLAPCHCFSGLTTDPMVYKIFTQRMKHAEQVLLDARDYASANPAWYRAYLDVAIDSGRGVVVIDQTFQQAIKKFPDYPPIYVAMAGRWIPDGSGEVDWGKLEDLVSNAVDLTRETEDLQNYARIYVAIGSRQQSGWRAWMLSRISWPTMRDSFKELLKHYPSEDNLNEFASFACRANDRETYLTLMPMLSGHVEPDLWPRNFSVDLCNHHFMQST